MKKTFLITALIYAIAYMAYAEPEIVVQEGHNVSTKFVNYSADGKYIFSWDGQQVKLWNMEKGKLIRTFSNIGDTKPAFSPNAVYFIYALDKNIEICYCETDERKLICKDSAAISLNFGRFASFAFSPDGKYFAFTDLGKIHIYNAKNLKREIILKKSENSIDRDFGYGEIKFSDDGKFLLFHGGLNTNRITVWDIQKENIISDFVVPFTPRDCDFSPNKQYISYFGWNSDSFVVRDLRTKKIVSEISVGEKYLQCLRFHSDYEIFISTSNTVKAYNIFTKEQHHLEKYDEKGTISSLDFNFSKNVFAIATFYGLQVRSVTDGSLIKSVEPSDLTSVDYASESRLFVVTTGYRNIHLFNENFQKLEFPRNFPFSRCYYDYFIVVNNGMFFLLKNNQNYCIYFYNFITDQVSYLIDADSADKKADISDLYASLSADFIIWKNKCYKLENNSLKRIAPSEIPPKAIFITSSYKLSWGKNKPYRLDSTYKLVETDVPSKYETEIKRYKGSVTIKNKETGKIVSSITPNVNISKQFLTHNDTCLTVLEGRILRCYAVESGMLLTSLVVESTSGWCSYTPEGYFNGNTDGVRNLVHVVNGLEVSELGQYTETFYRPDLVAAKINGINIQNSNTQSLEEVLSSGEAPFVYIEPLPKSSSSREIIVNFTVRNTGGGIGDVFISHNGKVIQLAKGTKKFKLDSLKTNKNDKPISYSATISLFDGENTIEAYATNEAGKIESCHSVAKISWHGSTSKPNLFILGLGINDYNAPNVSKLNFAVPDVLSIVKTFQEKSDGGMYGKVTTSSLLDDEVSKPQILKEINGIAYQIKPDDVFILYISGHGTAYNGDYYFISYDFDGKNLETAVSKDFILDCLSKISASKTVILLDTCNSGAIVGGGDSDTAFARLSQKTGQAIIAASSDTQYALEGYDGHGVFTYALLDALSGKADFVSDNQITLLELNLYVSNIVPMLTKLKWNHSQNPWYDLRKQDFPLLEK